MSTSVPSMRLTNYVTRSSIRLVSYGMRGGELLTCPHNTDGLGHGGWEVSNSGPWCVHGTEPHAAAGPVWVSAMNLRGSGMRMGDDSVMAPGCGIRPRPGCKFAKCDSCRQSCGAVRAAERVAGVPRRGAGVPRTMRAWDRACDCRVVAMR